MSLGLAITGMTAYFVGNKLLNGELAFLFQGSTPWIVALLPLAFVLLLSFGIHRMSYTVASVVFALYALVNGFSLSPIFYHYTGGSIALVFFITSGMFGSLALLGMFTKVDLSKYSSILFMGLIGLIIAGIANYFLQSPMLSYITSGIGVLIFAGLTAYDVQKLMNIGVNADIENDSIRKIAIMGALTLYLDFINLFLYLLRFLGNRRD
jgi:FtsH-binding integral membrane protein